MKLQKRKTTNTPQAQRTTKETPAREPPPKKGMNRWKKAKKTMELIPPGFRVNSRTLENKRILKIRLACRVAERNF